MMPLKDDAGSHVGYVKILRDRTRERLRERRLALVSQAASALLTADDPSAAIRPMLEEGAEAIGFDQSYTYDITIDRRHLRLTHSIGTDEETRTALVHVPYAVPICGIVAETYKPIVLTNILGNDEERYALARQSGLDAYAGFPIRDGGDVVGVISFGSRTQAAFDAEALTFFETMADLLSAARQRVSAEGKLRAERERSRLAQEAGRVGAFEIDVASDTMMVSAEFCRTFGLPVADTYPTSVLEALVLPEDAAGPSSLHTRREGSASSGAEYRIRRADDGRVRWIARRAEFARDPSSGAVANMFGTLQDITDRVDRERRQTILVELGDRLRDLGDVVSVAGAAAECVARGLGASRTGFGTVDLDDETIDVPTDWCAPGISSVAGHHQFRSFGSYVENLQRGETVAITDVTVDPRTQGGAEALIAIQARALLNLPILEQGRLVLVVFAHQAEAYGWTDDELLFVRQIADRTQAAIGRIRAEEQQSILNQEISHRLKNTLAMVQAIASQTLRQVAERDAVEALNHRIGALARAHEILLHQNWLDAQMADVTKAVLATFEDGRRFLVSGPDVLLGPRATLSYSLLLHEMATNALKYGALSVPEGHVDIV